MPVGRAWKSFPAEVGLWLWKEAAWVYLPVQWIGDHPLLLGNLFCVALTLCDPLPPAPLPMAHIEKLAADCMRDVEEEEEEEGLEEDADLLVRLPGWC